MVQVGGHPACEYVAKKMAILYPMFEVIVKPKIQKAADSMPAPERRRFGMLLESLRDKGPVQGSFPNYSKLGGNKHHCHLSPRWVACWEETEKGVKLEVYYVGSRGNAPY